MLALPRSPGARVVSLVIAWAALFLVGLGDPVINREQELRVALTARNMAEGGSWMIPEYRGDYRIRKPPMMYWIVATAYEVAGSTRSLVAARLPSAVAALALALAVYGFGARIMGRRRAWFAALVVLSSFIVMRQGRLAETDVLLTLLTSTSAMCGLAALVAPRPTRWWLLAGISGGLGFMTKGPAALALPLVSWLAFASTRPRRWKNILSPATLPGLALFVAIVVPWYTVIFFDPGLPTAGQQQVKSEMARILTEKHHAGSIAYYFYTAFHAFAPWSLLLPIGLFAISRRMWHHVGLRYVILWFGTSFITLTLLSNKQIHYATLLAAPACLVMGWVLGHRGASAGQGIRRFSDGIVTLTLLLLAAAGFIVALRLFLPASWPGTTCCLYGLAVATPALIGLFGCPAVRVLGIVFAMGATTAFDARVASRIEKDVYLIPEFVERMRDQLLAAPEVHIVGDKGAIAEFYSPQRSSPAGSVELIWPNVAPGAIVLAAGSMDVYHPRDVQGTAPALKEQRGKITVSLYIKPRP